MMANRHEYDSPEDRRFDSDRSRGYNSPGRGTRSERENWGNRENWGRNMDEEGSRYDARAWRPSRYDRGDEGAYGNRDYDRGYGQYDGPEYDGRNDRYQDAETEIGRGWGGNRPYASGGDEGRDWGRNWEGYGGRESRGGTRREAHGGGGFQTYGGSGNYSGYGGPGMSGRGDRGSFQGQGGSYEAGRYGAGGMSSGYMGSQPGWGGGLGDYSERGRYTGRGPKNYRRSDERIQEDINERLTRHGDVDASEIEVEVHNGEVTLRGSVDHRNTRRLAEDIAESVSGVKQIHNQLRVGSHEHETAAQGSRAGSSPPPSQTGRNK